MSYETQHLRFRNFHLMLGRNVLGTAAVLFIVGILASNASCGTGAEGTEGNACHEDGSCDEGLVCDEGICVDQGEEDEKGTEGNACHEDGSCDEGLVCDEGICVDQGEEDEKGTEGNACHEDGSCDEGLVCVDDLCQQVSGEDCEQDCSELDGWYDVGDAYDCCDDNTLCICQNQEYQSYGCVALECVYEVTDERTTLSECETCDEESSCAIGECIEDQCVTSNLDAGTPCEVDGEQEGECDGEGQCIEVESNGYQLGDVGPAGGTIFYDKGHYSKDDDPDAWRYLELAPLQTEWETKPWGGQGTDILAVEDEASFEIGMGKHNTSTIVSALGDADGGEYAANLCWTLAVEEFSDWFLPSREEMRLLVNRYNRGDLPSFAPPPQRNSNWYWISNQNSASMAQIGTFRILHGSPHGSISGYFKDGRHDTPEILRIRCVRRF